MSIETTVNNGSQLTNNYDISKIFLWNNRYAKADYTNDSGDEEELVAGTVLGRIAATGKVAKLDSGATDGSQYPVGVLRSEMTIPDGETEEVYYCIEGDVDEDKLIFQGYDDLDTEVSDRIYRDHLRLLGIKPIESTEHTNFDN